MSYNACPVNVDNNGLHSSSIHPVVHSSSSSAIPVSVDEVISPRSTSIRLRDNVHHVDLDLALRYQQASQTISISLDAKEAAETKTVSETALAEMIGTAGKDWENQSVHYCSLDNLFMRFGTNPEKGLDIVQQVHGHRVARNLMSPPYKQHWLLHFAEVALGGFNWLLIIIAILDILSWKPLGEDPGPPLPINWYTGTTLFICIFVNTCFNGYQLRKTSNLLSSFKSMVPVMATVLNDGKWMQINASELQIGDIVRIDNGIKVPADMRLISCQSIKVDKSLLTGESEPISCSIKCTSKNYFETKNMLFFGTLIVEGNGTGVVVDIGDNTVMGKICKMTGEAKGKKTTLQVEIDRFVKIILRLIIITGAAGLLAWGFWIRVDYPFYLTTPSMVSNMCSFVVGYTPEGLQVALTMTLSIVARRLAKHNVLIKDLAIVETFNTISLIASDKTGTLTLNKMSVANVKWGLNGQQQLNDKGIEADSSSTEGKNKNEHEKTESDETHASFRPLEVPLLRELFQCATLCNSAERVNPIVYAPASFQSSDRSSNEAVSSSGIKGDASDIALFNWVETALDVATYRARYPILAALPFNSRNKYAITIHEQLGTTEGPRLLFMKGAPEIILTRCSHVLHQDDKTEGCTNFTRVLTSTERSAWAAEQEHHSAQGQRMLGFAMQYLNPVQYPRGYVFNMSGDNEPNYPTHDLIFLGVISLTDPPRPEVPGAVAKCKSAHIRVAMVTGDHPTTGAAIAEQVGLLSLPARHNFEVREDGFGMSVLALKRNGEIVGSYRRTAAITSSTDHPNISDSLFYSMETEQTQANIPLNSEWNQQAPHAKKIDAGIVITGVQIPFLDERLWNWVLRHQEMVFARTTPEQKLKIVMESQRLGERVACSGDGVNDAPALRQSHLGIAMFAGSEVAREAGHVILLDNNFGSIVTGIELGRGVYDNLKKVIIYLLPAGTWSEMLTVMFNIFFGIPSMLSTFLMIIICLLTDVFVSISMVNETAESDIMQRKPREPTEHLVNLKLLLTAYFTTGCFMTFAASFNFFWYAADQGLPFWGVFWAFSWGDGWYGFTANQLNEIVNTGQCIYFVTLVIMQWGNAFSVRTRRQSILKHNPFWGPHRNLYLPLGILAAFITLIVITLGPFFQTYFGTRQVPIKFALVACGWAVFLVLWDETRKWIVRNRPNSWIAKAAW